MAGALGGRPIYGGLWRPPGHPYASPPPRAAAGAALRYFIDLFGNGVDLRARFQEALEVVIESMSTPEWVERFRRDGWRAGARLEELGLAL
ncbi:hypothetical protein [Nocardia cyriacigeorgica]|uniref:hypothetical protein n=1 Tax=Nocardia cyriacigeorgica TaxID=135487 RepID=UPI00245539E4|nr:hypothetical protein [Nocardia cyriacigeorgica]